MLCLFRPVCVLFGFGFFVFFFSSRRRHTRFKCDWSSDVCSSDLAFLPGNLPAPSLAPASGAYLAPNVVGGVTRGSSLTPFGARFQSGTYALGAPRQFGFGLRMSCKGQFVNGNAVTARPSSWLEDTQRRTRPRAQ